MVRLKTKLEQKKVVQIARRNLRQFILAQKAIDASQQQEKPHRT